MEQADANQGTRNWQSVRTVLEGLILAGICWLIRSTGMQGEAIIKLQTQFESQQQANASLISAMPSLARQVDKIQLQVDSHERRVSDLEQLRRVH
jgi:hypothetical protein